MMDDAKNVMATMEAIEESERRAVKRLEAGGWLGIPVLLQLNGPLVMCGIEGGAADPKTVDCGNDVVRGVPAAERQGQQAVAEGIITGVIAPSACGRRLLLTYNLGKGAVVECEMSPQQIAYLQRCVPVRIPRIMQ